ncbi:glycosyltransferase [Alterisphingorhabdus coralli]|uniref:Glycosyltransferase n=1 Tax=Alterisphingorhabdus coralli TaxID=3071408 RepID=A0AA97FA18_9SPHN|nr:glycosyltransferase [Parasphingorhabdus sp. SCSIO 66989]WOE75265.1 glycosyltransferase [Parasphingorhabdus sp. SCSIO 66989]
MVGTSFDRAFSNHQGLSIAVPHADNILMITPNFPPYAMAGAVRTGALARHWAAAGRQVHVLAAANPGALGVHQALEVEGITAEFLPIDREGAQAEAAPAAQPDATAKPDKPRSAPGPLRRILWDLQAMPDRYNPHWVARAADRGIAIARDTSPSLVYSSGPPNSAHIAAAKIKAVTGLPWISEQRDVWINNPYTSHHWLTEIFNTRLARRILPAANAFVGVTRSAVGELQQHFDAPVCLAYNGFDRQDFVPETDSVEAPTAYDPERLTLIHAGVIYAGHRDPRPLFAAIALLPREQAAKIRVLFFHDEYDYVTQLAKEHDVLGSVEFRALVPREEILALERRVDVLIICRSHEAKTAGVIPGKLFEYIGARRPMLAMGSERGETVEIIRDHGFGLASNDPQAIADQLLQWLEQKAAHCGRIPDLPEAPTHNFVRSLQFKKIDALIDQMLGRKAPQPETERAVA